MTQLRFLVVLLLSFFSVSNNLAGQEKGLLISLSDTSSEAKKMRFKTQFASEQNARNYTKTLVNTWRNEGYLLASLDSFIADENGWKAYMFLGNQYRWSRFYSINLNEQAIQAAGAKQRNFTQKAVNVQRAARMLNRALLWYEDNGFPFARLYLDSIVEAEKTIEAGIHVETGERFFIDSVSIRGDARIQAKFLENYIGIHPGDVYNESQIMKLSSRIKELPFVREQKPPEVLLLEKDAIVRLYLSDRKASTVNGMIGFLPNNEQTGGLLLTGEANLRLRNSFGRGELIDAEWRRLQVATQSLNIKVAWPFLFNSRFGVDGFFNLYKRDTTFINLYRGLGVQYLMEGTDYLKAFFESRSSNLLNTQALQNVSVLPDFADIRSNLYGLELSFTRLDYRLNPRKGIRTTIRAGAGNRVINKNPALNQELYEGLVLRALNWQTSSQIEWFIPLGKKSTFLQSWKTMIMNSTNLFENELSRIGGINSLRGFDEESIFAASFAILNLEYRYLFEENSNFFLFWNGAYYENRAFNRDRIDRPIGFGAGMSFEVKAGIFTISYALGRQFDNPIEFRTAKVHFGITSLF